MVEISRVGVRATGGPAETVTRMADDQKLAALRDRIDAGDYRVDPAAVADAILRRRSEFGGLLRGAGSQSECSKPDSDPLASMKRAPASPRVTWPIQVIRTRSFVLANFASISLRPPGGAQMQSS